MRILLATQHRDFLSGFAEYLELSGYEVSPAFDGVKALEHLSKGTFDAAVLEIDLPRVPHGELLSRLRQCGTPSIVLLKSGVSKKILGGDALAESYLSYPFLPEELTAKIEEVTASRRSDETISLANMSLSVSDFSLNGVRITLEEIKILKCISRGEAPDIRRADIFVDSLNKKLSNAGSVVRIEYTINEGYRFSER